jgi:ABC-type nitrate/sulfonate/bicarbonate transport system substrate-binding protein
MRGTRQSRLAVVSVAIATLVSLVLVVGLGCGRKSSETWPTLRIGYLPVAAELPLFVAIENGYLEQAGLKWELARLASSNELGNAATADRVDILAGAASNVIFDIGTVSGKKHLVFAVNPYSNRPGHITDQLIARVGSGIKELADIRGKKVASFPGSVNRIFTYLILEKYGVPRDSYTYTEMLPKDWQPSLQTGAVDVVSALEPSATQIIHDSVGYSIFQGFYADLMPDVPLSAHWIAADYYARADKAQITAFLNAYDQAISFCREHPDSAKTFLVKYASVREDILSGVNLNPWLTLSEIDAKQLQAYVDLLADNQALQVKVDAERYILPDPRKK